MYRVFRQSSEAHYIVRSPSQEDEGDYTCVAANTAGTGLSNVYLDVKGKSTSYVKPQNF